MRRATAELIVKDPNKFAHHDRVFLNNPVVMQGMGLAPLVVLATSGQNAVMLAVAVALLLVPSRVLACLLSRLVPLHDEDPAPETLQKKLLPRALMYGFSTAVVYLAVYPILNMLFSTSLLSLGIYLPLLTMEPLLTYRFGRVQETVRKPINRPRFRHAADMRELLWMSSFSQLLLWHKQYCVAQRNKIPENARLRGS